MESLTLPQTDLVISRVGFGGGALACPDHGWIDEREARDAVAQAIDVGINLFDTADVYGLGEGETRLSQALGSRRHDVVIVSKGGVNWEPRAEGRARTFRDSSPRRILEALEGSLRRLGVDAIPLYLVHWPDPATPIEDTVSTLADCVDMGKIRYFGFSNFDHDLFRQGARLARVSALEIPYSLVDRSVETQILPQARALDVGTLAYGPLGQGLLTGKYNRQSDFDSEDRRRQLPHFASDQWVRNEEVLKRLSVMAQEYGRTMGQVAIRWVLDSPDISAVIVGAKSPDQVVLNAGAADWYLEPKDRQFLADAQPPAPGAVARGDSGKAGP